MTLTAAQMRWRLGPMTPAKRLVLHQVYDLLGENYEEHNGIVCAPVIDSEACDEVMQMVSRQTGVPADLVWEAYLGTDAAEVLL